MTDDNEAGHGGSLVSLAEARAPVEEIPHPSVRRLTPEERANRSAARALLLIRMVKIALAAHAEAVRAYIEYGRMAAKRAERRPYHVRGAIDLAPPHCQHDRRAGHRLAHDLHRGCAPARVPPSEDED